MNFEQFLKSEYVQGKKMLQTKDQVDWVKGFPTITLFKLEEVENTVPTLLKQLYKEELVWRTLSDITPVRNLTSGVKYPRARPMRCENCMK
jgi:hypothetical protein